MTNGDTFIRRTLIPKRRHPIETKRYIMSTPEIERAIDRMSQWIENRIPGAMIWGRPRLGKTRAIRYAITVLPQMFNQTFPVFMFSCKRYRQPNENTFYEDLLKDLGHALFSSGKANAKRGRIVKFLHERALVNGNNQVVLLIDDAQHLNELHYEWLMDVYNELDNVGINLTVILCGQEELLSQRSAFIATKKQQLVGRFMIHEYHFRGVKNVSDLQRCLESYDNYEIAEYPERSGWSYTRYYFPERFKEGFRLKNYSQDFFDTIRELRGESGVTSKPEIPMQYITLCIAYIMKSYGVDGQNVEILNQTHWKQAIIKSGYIEAEAYRGVFD